MKVVATVSTCPFHFAPVSSQKQKSSSKSTLFYFSDEKSWMSTQIMIKVLSMLDAKMKSQNRNVILFIDNAHCLPLDLRTIKVCFLPTNTTSGLQPIDAGISQSFQVKYCKLLLKSVISRAKRQEYCFRDSERSQCFKSYQTAQRRLKPGG